MIYFYGAITTLSSHNTNREKYYINPSSSPIALSRRLRLELMINVSSDLTLETFGNILLQIRILLTFQSQIRVKSCFIVRDIILQQI